MISFGKISVAAFLILLVSCVNEQQKTVAKKEVKIETKTESFQETPKQYIPQFEINFPLIEANIQKTEVVDSVAGNVLVTQWFKEGTDDNGPFIYYVLHYKLPPTVKTQLKNDPNSYNEVLQSELMRSNVRLNGSECTFSEVEQKSFKGLESTCKAFKGDGIVKSRIYLVGNNLFIVGAGGKNIKQETVDSFINSFKLK
jgi:hypothetical protein